MDLQRLIETEQRNDALVLQAREEAEATVRAARERIAAREADLSRMIEDAAADEQRKLDAERDHRIAGIRADAAESCARYEAVSDTTIAAIIPDLLGALIAAGTS